MEIKPIRSESDYDKALHRIETLWGSSPGSNDGNELDVLATLIEVYEHEHYPSEPPSPVEAIKFRLEQSGKSYKDLTGILGPRTRVYEIMRGTRPLTLQMIRSLHQQLGIPAEVLIQPISTKPKRARASGSVAHAVRSRGRSRRRA